MIKEGAIFKGGINNDRYYEITKVLNKTVKIREIKRKIEEELGDDNLIHWVYRPIKGDYIGEEISKRIIILRDGIKILRINDECYFLINR